MTGNSVPVAVASTLLVCACSPVSDGPSFSIDVGGNEFVADTALGIVEIPITLENRGGAAGRTSFCAPRPGDRGINLSVERNEGGDWVGGRDSCFFACAPPTFGEVVLAAGELVLDTVVLGIGAGRYRLRVLYHPLAVTEQCLRSEPSREFVVRDP